jgi:amino acid transporter
MLNHFGLKLAGKITDFSGVLILICTIVLIVITLANLHHPLDLTRLVRLENLTGQSGGNVVPHTASLVLPFCMSLLLPLYTITGFDGSAHIAEETMNAQRTVPKAIMYAILWAVLLGGFLVCCFVLTFVDVHQAARQGDQVIFRLLRDLPMADWVRGSLYVAIVAANYLCGLAAVTSTSRLVFAFARDGGLPSLLRYVKSKTQCPVAAVWATAFVSILAALYSPAFQVLATGCAVLLYIAYAMPIAAAFLAEQRGWDEFGPFRLCRFSRPFAILSVAGVFFATYLGLRAPNTVLRGSFLFLLCLLLCLWAAFARKAFVGPQLPAVSIRKQASVWQ